MKEKNSKDVRHHITAPVPIKYYPYRIGYGLELLRLEIFGILDFPRPTYSQLSLLSIHSHSQFTNLYNLETCNYLN